MPVSNNTDHTVGSIALQTNGVREMETNVKKYITMCLRAIMR